MKKIILGILTVVFIVAAGCENELGYDGILKIGFVYQGRASQPGWSRSHDLARRAVATALAGQVETTSVEFVAPKFAEHAMRRLALSGHRLIFATAIAYQDATARVAADFPGVRFEQLGGHRRTANVATYTARFYEARAVLGLIAGNMTKTNIIGYVASIPVPEVVQGIDAFTLALRQVRPNAVVKVIWIGSFYDRAAEAQAAEHLVDLGADVLVQHTGSAAVVQVAERRGVYAFGKSGDMREFGPTAQLTASLDRWDGYYIARAKAVIEGRWKSQDTWSGIGDGMVELAPYSSLIPPSVRQQADDMTHAIAQGTLNPFAGPIIDRDGQERIPQGRVASDSMLQTLDWYVPGVEDVWL
ncbi:MAG: BMP family ABC transporter substrate-binding protein [Alphaproteobacteria bacterium]|nr:BMP family ABC transporter substrate-binding protein [Alphaproteobacteria bacterium]